MSSIFNALNIGYSGLVGAQAGVNTTSHNISNAESEGYTRQRVVTSASNPLALAPGSVGNGVDVTDIKRVFDNFVFDRYTDISAKSEYSQYEEKMLEQLSTYFPEIDNVGIKADLAEFYNMWQTLSDNPDNDAVKVALAEQTETLSTHINQTQEQISTLQTQLNKELLVNVNEVNFLAEELANINNSINVAEAAGVSNANDLRDKRNVIENNLAKLIGADVTVGVITSNIGIDSSSNTSTGSYMLSVNGLNLVDGNSFHPIQANNTQNPFGFYELSFERQDGVLMPLEENINSGRIGAILNLRGGTISESTGMPVDGTVQRTLSELEAFATSLIETTNNIYASSSTNRMESNILDINSNGSLVNSGLNINEGSFDIVVYDIDGEETARRSINIDASTRMVGVANSNSIQGQLEVQKDDNNDSNANNDVDDYVNYNWATYSSGDKALEFSLDQLSESLGYTFAIEDTLSDSTFSSGTNFAGALGLSRYFDGDDASNISMNLNLRENATLISSGRSPASGDNNIALNMIQHQFEEFQFDIGKVSYKTTTNGMFDIIATGVGTATNAAILSNETITAQFNAVELEYYSTSKVSIDEEMTNLIKYQTAYGAAAKLISTIDQMMQTLLGIKN